MAAAKPDPLDLSQGGVEALQDHFRNRFAGDTTLRRAIGSVLDDIAQHWNDYSAIEPASFDAMRSGLSPHLKALLELPSTDCKSPCDALVSTWEALKPNLVWL
jgi:hypothetical protein